LLPPSLALTPPRFARRQRGRDPAGRAIRLRSFIDPHELRRDGAESFGAPKFAKCSRRERRQAGPANPFSTCTSTPTGSRHWVGTTFWLMASLNMLFERFLRERRFLEDVSTRLRCGQHHPRNWMAHRRGALERASSGSTGSGVSTRSGPASGREPCSDGAADSR